MHIWEYRCTIVIISNWPCGRRLRTVRTESPYRFAPAGRINSVAVPDGDVPDDERDPVELGVELLAHLEHASLSVAAAMDRIETVTTNPALQREIIDTAAMRGVIERENGVVRPRSGGTYVSFETDVVVREGEFSCARCGASLSTGHFVQFDGGELGPFGSTCVRKVLGRE